MRLPSTQAGGAVLLTEQTLDMAHLGLSEVCTFPHLYNLLPRLLEVLFVHAFKTLQRLAVSALWSALAALICLAGDLLETVTKRIF